MCKYLYEYKKILRDLLKTFSQANRKIDQQKYKNDLLLIIVGMYSGMFCVVQTSEMYSKTTWDHKVQVTT